MEDKEKNHALVLCLGLSWPISGSQGPRIANLQHISVLDRQLAAISGLEVIITQNPLSGSLF